MENENDLYMNFEPLYMTWREEVEEMEIAMEREFWANIQPN